MGGPPLLVIGRFVSAHRSPGEAGEPTTECPELSGAEEPSGCSEGDSNGNPTGPTGLDWLGRHVVSLGAMRLLLPIGTQLGVVAWSSQEVGYESSFR